MLTELSHPTKKFAPLSRNAEAMSWDPSRAEHPMTMIVDPENLPAISSFTNFGVTAKYNGPPST